MCIVTPFIECESPQVSIIGMVMACTDITEIKFLPNFESMTCFFVLVDL